MSGRGLGKRWKEPAHIDIVVSNLGDDQSGGHNAKKTSTVTASRHLGSNLKLGLLVDRGQGIKHLRFRAGEDGFGNWWPCKEITHDHGWQAVLDALAWHLAPLSRQEWILFELPDGLNSEFTSELIFVSPPQLGQRIPLRAIHATTADSLDDLQAAFDSNAYGEGESVVEPPQNP